MARYQPAAQETSMEERLLSMGKKFAETSNERFVAMEARLHKMELIIDRLSGKLERNEAVTLEDVQ
jgi:hypothetical protein